MGRKGASGNPGKKDDKPTTKKRGRKGKGRKNRGKADTDKKEADGNKDKERLWL